MPAEKKKPYLDCCEDPSLITIKNIYQSEHDSEALLQCENCEKYWFYRYNEYRDDWTVWYSLLNNDDAKLILNSKERPNLDFLSNRTSFMEDAEGVKKVQGQPTYPKS